MGKTALYIGDFKFGIMDAQSQLVLGNCEILRALGYRVVLIGNDNSLAHGRSLCDSKADMRGFDMYNVYFSKGIQDLFRVAAIHRQIISVAGRYQDLNLVICYGTSTFAVELSLLASWCRQRNVAFVANCVDLPCQAHGSTLERCIKTVDRKWREYVYKYKTDGIIAVSKYIADHYGKNSEKPIVVVPPLKDTLDIHPPDAEEWKQINMVYIGVPFPIDGRKVSEKAYKDRIDRFIEMLCQIREHTNPFQFHVYGINKDQYLKVIKQHSSLLENNGDIIRFHGRIPHSMALEAVKGADYCVLYRCVNEMTMAGFSSKLVESISCGTPLILTDTSDYCLYLQNGVHCHLLDANDATTSKETLISILKMDRKAIAAMKTACYESRMFDYRNYTSEMGKFIETVFAGGKRREERFANKESMGFQRLRRSVNMR